MGSFFPCLMFLVLPPFFIYLMNRSIMGEIGCATALLMTGTSVYLFGIICLIDDPYLHYAAIAGIISLLIGLPVLTAITEKWDDRQMESEQIKICYQQIRMNPQNAMAAFRLAQILHKKGEKHVAIAIADGCIPHMAPHLFREEHKQYVYWKNTADPTAPTEVQCAGCRKMAPAGALICPHCLGSLHLDRAQKFNVATNKKSQKIFAVWVTILVVLFAIPLLRGVTPAIAVPSVLVLLGLGIGAVISAFDLGFHKK
ncbi:MAG: hypothetical protein JST12_08330 [Armatimonadetes bacterium]|nr:hypothetical protein [Armatimonadota bacterium]MBS1701653.1 hypothetical protein [Armatimonadota bacterium]MBS1727282.1 hypothetical protein [Armatimonadota bacterium]